MMKYIWEEEDIEAGVFVHRGKIGGKDNTCDLKKIGFLCLDEKIYDDRRSDELLVLVCMTDGLTTSYGSSKKEIAEELTKHGYQPTTNGELVRIIKDCRSYISREKH